MFRVFGYVLFACIVSSLVAEEYGYFDDAERLFLDLQAVNYWNEKKSQRLPVTYNHLLQGGYFMMPSARMGCEGELALGYSWVSPYRLYSLRAQILNRLEVSGNYRVFTGIPDPILSPYGFGDLSDKGANIKFALLLPEDSDYRLPGIAIGTEDFIGTKGFHSRYIVLTKIFPTRGLEVSLGWGWQRYNGLFGGVTWFPFYQSGSHYLEPLSFSAEYDPTRYGDPSIEKHPKGRRVNSRINVGAKYRIANLVDLTLSYLRGRELAFSASMQYNVGHTKGFLPKIHDALPYRSPVNHQAITPLRPEYILSQDLAYAFYDQGFTLLETRLGWNECGQPYLWLRINNTKWRQEWAVRQRCAHILSSLVPSNIVRTIVVIEAEGFPLQEYHFPTDYLYEFYCCQLGEYELSIVAPLCEYEPLNRWVTRSLYKRPRDFWNIEIYPKTHTLFGSAKGKFKYGLGLSGGLNGFIGKGIYYSLVLGWIVFSDLHDVSDVDRLNPSQLIHVRTDAIRYFQQKGITLDEAYLQKVWNFGRGWFVRLAGGYFEQAYGGVAAELLYYPLCSSVALGLEGAVVGKRNYSGIGFTHEIRKLHGFEPSYTSFIGSQYFFTFIYKFYEADIDLKISAGKFLANDYGIRYELSRYFPSGLQLFLWYTWTNGDDKINGQTYYDKGVGLSMPLDIFYTYSSRTRWNYVLGAWLRDVGARSYTGRELYELVNENRQ